MKWAKLFWLVLVAQAGMWAVAQQAGAGTGDAQGIRFNVVVENKGGEPVTGLQQQDFKVLDNKSPAQITSFRALSAAQEPVHVIVIVDAVNPPFSMVAYGRDGVSKFFRANGGKLPFPTTFGFVTDAGVQLDKNFTTDGNRLSDALAHYNQGLRTIHRDSQYGGVERMQISVTAMAQLTGFAGPIPGRKLVIWVSPGWPLLTGPRIDLDQRQENELFANVVQVSTELRKADVTMYDVNPVGVQESLLRADYYKEFLKGVRSPRDTQIGNLALQVISVQSGGMSFESNSDVTGEVERCVKDGASWYEITIAPGTAEKPNEFHEVQVEVDRKDATARTRNGYYAQR